ncbi:FAD-linked oxidase C-terminal domain-containing protein [Tenggerimyces flavus]|uniref:FAD-linked oxidase C-terminal domain-containing protein n=1 Tax=Tenggerimyces flavus TaxID=1708749 RepID=A0ABV7YAG5_9ACTN|nr:FAD-linked oxidase C-terminal domain-containing protein [Tenggerimyces flavus]MBM7788987.1 glycolate oxidase [Tenggerimyces flavus]
MSDLGKLRRELEDLLGADGVISDPVQLRTYECDGLAGYRVTPSLVVLPTTSEQVAESVAAAHRAGVPFVARGAGTGLSGGALPVAEGIVIGLQRMRAILEIDPVNRRAVVEPGVTNLAISKAAAPYDLYYAPDPSSQQVCTIGGNVAENSGGAHCLKYGFTTNHVLAMEVVLPDGTRTWLGGPSPEVAGPDLRGVVIGSEGTVALVTKVVVRLLRKPESVRTLLADFPSIEQAGDTVTDVIGAGIVPAAMEIMDQLAIEASEAAVGAGYTLDTPAALVVELDGPNEECALLFDAVREICQRNGTTKIRVAADDAERLMIWTGRKAAFAAVGRISPDYFVQDGVVPRTRLAEALSRIGAMGRAAGIRVANVFHAGDGNLHPLVLYSEEAGEHGRAEKLSKEIAELCVELGGSLSGEHGIGTDKACSMPTMFTEDDLATMDKVRRAFDPENLCNPGKLLPTPRLCGERPGKYRPHPLEQAGVIDRL